MATVEIVGIGKVLPKEKRCYVPGIVLKSRCPACGREEVKDLASEYLPNGSLDVGFYCSGPGGCDSGCDYEWSVKLRVEIQLFEVAE